eukprot:8535235-Lingulodinium_polyedra.AAC.1
MPSACLHEHAFSMPSACLQHACLSMPSACLPQEFVVAMRAVATLRPNVNPEQKTGVLVAMQFVKRLKLDTKWPELVKAMKPVFVGGMMAALSLACESAPFKHGCILSHALLSKQL